MRRTFHTLQNGLHPGPRQSYCDENKQTTRGNTDSNQLIGQLRVHTNRDWNHAPSGTFKRKVLQSFETTQSTCYQRSASIYRLRCMQSFSGEAFPMFRVNGLPEKIKVLMVIQRLLHYFAVGDDNTHAARCGFGLGWKNATAIVGVAQITQKSLIAHPKSKSNG